MPTFIEIAEPHVSQESYEQVFNYLTSIDERFSTYKPESEISRINRGEIAEDAYSGDMREIFRLADATARATDGYFDIRKPDGTLDPSGVVKGWAIQKASELLERMGHENFYIEVAGDVQTKGVDAHGRDWTIGIRSPFTADEIVKVITPQGQGVATSGTYIRGEHIYDPHTGVSPEAFVSLTVVGPDIYEADRFATAAFAMGPRGLAFLESLPGLEAYAIDPKGVATMTSGFEALTLRP